MPPVGFETAIPADERPLWSAIYSATKCSCNILWSYVCTLFCVWYNNIALCEFPGFRSGGLCSSGKCTVSLVTGDQCHWTFRLMTIRPLRWLETSGTGHPVTRRHIPGHRRPHPVFGGRKFTMRLQYRSWIRSAAGTEHSIVELVT